MRRGEAKGGEERGVGGGGERLLEEDEDTHPILSSRARPLG